MNKKKNIKILFITLVVICFISALCSTAVVKRNSINALSNSWFFQAKQNEAPEYQPGRYTTIIDEQENVLSMMSRAVYAGDEIYTAEGKIYRLERVQGDLAAAHFLGMDPQIVALNEFFASQEVPAIKENTDNKPAPPANFAIYHTHTDESYIPSEGTHTIKFKGGIFKVGKVMVERLRKVGMGVSYDQTPHDPHDNNAYVRSRRTAAKLLKTNPVAMFDVHRDGVPDPNYYREKIYGQDVSSLRLVIGRQNPRMSANLDFAKQMLTAVNNVHPKVVKEIFVGKGDYNQDLLPTALLIEAGTYTNSREEAERGVDLFAQALPNALGISVATPAPQSPAAPTKSTGASRGAWKAVGWILGMTVIGALAFMLINNVKLSDMRRRLMNFSKEIIPLIPRQAARKLGINNENKRKNE